MYLFDDLTDMRENGGNFDSRADRKTNKIKFSEIFFFSSEGRKTYSQSFVYYLKVYIESSRICGASLCKHHKEIG